MMTGDGELPSQKVTLYQHSTYFIIPIIHTHNNSGATQAFSTSSIMHYSADKRDTKTRQNKVDATNCGAGGKYRP
jgi:hypothetical protein